MIAREEYAGGRAFEVVSGNLLEQDVDAIVNAANGHLAHGGGVAAAIARAAGPPLVEEGDLIVAECGPVPVGEAVVGRVLDPLGNPLDGKGPVVTTERRPVEIVAPGIAARQPVREPPWGSADRSAPSPIDSLERGCWRPQCCGVVRGRA